MFERDGQMDFAEGAALGGGLGLGALALGASSIGRRGIRAAAEWGKGGVDDGLRAGMGRMAEAAGPKMDQAARGAQAGFDRMGGGIRRNLGEAGAIAEQNIKTNPMAKLKALSEGQQIDPKFAEALMETGSRFAKGDREAAKQLLAMRNSVGDELKPLVDEVAQWAQDSGRMMQGAQSAGMAAGAGAAAVGVPAGLMGGGE